MNRSSYLKLIRGEKKGPLALLLRGLLWLLAIPYAFSSWSRNRLLTSAGGGQGRSICR
ncbi:MAG: hypothetical protein VB817_13400 [Pirellulaceae bacterium]